MPLSAQHIFQTLSEWPHRGTGSEDEMMAREALITELVGEPGVDVAEEGVKVPASYVPFFWLLGIGQLLTVVASIWAPVIAFLAGVVFFASYVLFFDWRFSPLIWMIPRKMSANLVAKKGSGDRLIILMAHLDSAPASYVYRKNHVKYFAVCVYFSMFIMALGVVIPWLDAAGFVMPLWLRCVVLAMLFALPFTATVDFWRFGYTPGGNDNLSGVAAATQAASNLWRHMPENTEVRLVLTTAGEAGMLGAQHYLRAHEDEFRMREAHVLNFDTVGNTNLKYIVKTSGFTQVYYEGPLSKAAEFLVAGNQAFFGVRPGKQHFGGFDSVWFQREGISALSLASYDNENMMPDIHTPHDTFRKVNIDQVTMAAKFGEGLIRMLPKAEGKENAS